MPRTTIFDERTPSCCRVIVPEWRPVGSFNSDLQGPPAEAKPQRARHLSVDVLRFQSASIQCLTAGVIARRL